MDNLIEIHKSTDYGWFKYLPTNRTVGTSTKVKDSVSTFDITPYVPIIVTKDGYPQAGLYHTKSKLLNGEVVDYLANVIPYSDKLRDEQINPDYHDGNTPAMYREFIITELKFA